MKKIFLLIIAIYINFYSAFSQFGTLDPTFGTGGIVLTNFDTTQDQSLDVLIQPDNKILTAGYSRNVFTDLYCIALARYLPNGTLDSSFNGTGLVKTKVTSFSPCITFANSIDFKSNKITVAGYFTPDPNDLGKKDIVIVRYNYNGSLDTTFDIDGMVTYDADYIDWIPSVVVDSVTNKTIVSFTSKDNQQNNISSTILRLSNNGSLDNSFGNNGVISIPSIYINGVALQSDRQILATGQATNMTVWRFNETDGSFDNSFGNNGKATIPILGYGFSMEIRSDGVIIILGENSSPFKINLAALNPNGTTYTNFGTGGILLSNIDAKDNTNNALALQPDNKIIITAHDFGTLQDFVLARFDSTGTLDNTFGTGGIVTTNFSSNSEDLSYACALQQDGNIVVAGYSDAGIAFDFALCRYGTGLLGTKNINSSAFDFTIHPNPATGFFTLPLVKNQKNVVLTISDINGEIIYKFMQPNSQNIEVSTKNLMSGFYFVQIQTGDFIVTKKLLVQK